MPQAKNKKQAAKGSKKASEAAKVVQEQEPVAQVVVQDEEEEPSEVRQVQTCLKILLKERGQTFIVLTKMSKFHIYTDF